MYISRSLLYAFSKKDNQNNASMNIRKEQNVIPLQSTLNNKEVIKVINAKEHQWKNIRESTYESSYAYYLLRTSHVILEGELRVLPKTNNCYLHKFWNYILISNSNYFKLISLHGNALLDYGKDNLFLSPFTTLL